MTKAEKQQIIEELMEELLSGDFVLESKYTQHTLSCEDGEFVLKEWNGDKPKVYKSFATALKGMEKVIEKC